MVKKVSGVDDVEGDDSNVSAVYQYWLGLLPLPTSPSSNDSIGPANAILGVAKDLGKIGSDGWAEWANKTREVAARNKKADLDDETQGRFGTATANYVLDQFFQGLANKTASEGEIGAVVSSAVAIAGPTAAIAHEQVVGFINTNTPFPIPIIDKATETDSQTLLYNFFITMMTTQNVENIPRVGGKTAKEVIDIQYALGYAKQVLTLIDTNAFAQSILSRLDPKATKEYRSQLIAMMKVKLLAGALAMIYKTSLGGGKGGQVAANITGKEFEALLNGGIKITFNDPKRQSVADGVLSQLNSSLSALSKNQQQELRTQLINFMNTNPSLEQLKKMNI